MEDHQGDFKLIKVIKFNNRKEDWTEFALKFRAIAVERGYDQILDGTEYVPGEFVEDPEVETDCAQAECLRNANKRGYRDLIQATKDMSSQ